MGFQEFVGRLKTVRKSRLRVLKGTKPYVKESMGLA
jgi:hypothetical protein